ncbi:hypothetical protein [Bradyrhizobium diversitatis]|uniref:hypothetical protein n=1 Tax=Bradyrhizobium diversitatis TaxID=2755406 RepID=UPI0024BF504C|nr:hypothetical protein [Bradyrhizobium diversitatis]
MTLIGPSGSGKTTVLRLAMTLGSQLAMISGYSAKASSSLPTATPLPPRKKREFGGAAAWYSSSSIFFRI